MKKFFLFLVFGLMLSFVNVMPTHALGTDWSITHFDVDMQAEEDSTLDITETIVADFTQDPHHGIIRSLPLKYTDTHGNRLNLRWALESITNEQGQEWAYTEYQQGGNLNLKIGDANRYLSGMATFIIHYRIQRAVNYFDDHDEIYWNVTGNEVEVPIQEASITIHSPTSIDHSNLEGACYTGYLFSQERSCNFNIDDSQITYHTLDTLYPGQGLTVVAGFPSGTLQRPSAWQAWSWFFQDNWPYLLPIVTFLALLIVWYKRGRNAHTPKNVIIPQYEAPGKMTPAEVGTLLDERADMRDLSSTLVDMAVRGYLKIEEHVSKKLLGKQRDYTFIKIKDWEDSPLKEYEKMMLKGIFGAAKEKELEDLKYHYYKEIPSIKSKIYSGMTTEKIFPTRPDKVRTAYFSAGLVIAFFGFCLLFALSDFIALPIGVAISGFIMAGFSPFMPVKTKKGMEFYYHALGLEDFIRTAERDRLKFQEKENTFETLLPYAMVFGLADKWSKAFEGIYKEMPKWFTTDDQDLIGNFNSFYLWNSLNQLSRVASANMTAMPRSSSGSSAWSGGSGFSGGFSGGGFGGGGTSGW